MTTKTKTKTKIIKDLVINGEIKSKEKYNVPKRKRGRPRKNQVVDKVTNNVPKKRGRKPLNSIIRKQLCKPKNIEDDILLNLPISLNDVKNYNKRKNIKHDDDDDDKSENSDIDKFDSDKFTINDMSINDTSSREYNDNVINIKNKLKQRDKLIKKLKDDINNYKNIINSSEMLGIQKRVIKKMKNNLINFGNGEKIIISNTDIACWWCSYKFSTQPCFLPEKFMNNKYYVSGCFCSCECAQAYNINTLNDFKSADRVSLMKILYNIKYDVSIKPAPAREVFEKFGGVLTIEKYRKNYSTSYKEYRLIRPPMASISPLIEEISSANIINKVQSITSDDDLVLKRSKPLNNKNNTIMEAIKFIKKNKKNKKNKRNKRNKKEFN